MAQTISADGAVRVNVGGANIGPDGVCLVFDEVGDVSLVLSKNTAPPGSPVNLVDVAYVDGGLVARAAGVAITGDGLAYVSAADAALDLYVTATITSGYVVVRVSPASIGGAEGAVPAADVTPGTFGATTGATGSYTFPGASASTTTHTAASLIATTDQRLGSATAGAATSALKKMVATAGIPDNTATTVLTVTVPNAVASATIRLTAIGALGAGGAIGAGEAVASNSYDLTIVRTAGVNAVADISTAFGVNAANVAGAASCTAALTVASVAGAVGAVNTFPVQITVVKSGGSSDNHTAVVIAEVVSQVGGITVA